MAGPAPGAHLRSYPRPDGRTVVWPAGRWTPDQARAAVELARSRGITVLTNVDDGARDERRTLEEAGFVAARREAMVQIALDPALAALSDAQMPDGVVIRSVSDVDVDRLRLLDDKLRDDVPGTSGWRSTREDFHSDTFDDSAFEPRTYLVAVEETTGDYVGLVRVWMNPKGPRIGMIGVRRPYRRRGIASALLARALEAVRSLGAGAATTEFDVTNEASAALVRSLGAVRVGTMVEFSYRAAPTAGDSLRTMRA